MGGRLDFYIKTTKILLLWFAILLLMKSSYFALLAGLSFLLSSSAVADTFYRETFNFCEEPSGRPSAYEVAGWHAIKTNDPIGKPTTLKIQPVGASTRLSSVNNNPEGPEDGSAFWGRDDVTKGLLIYSDEINVDISEIKSVVWRQRIDRQVKVFANYQPRVAFLIDGIWYISDRIAPQIVRGIWERKEIALSTTTFGTVADTPGIGIFAPTNSGNFLPSSGMVSAVGLFMVRAYARVRIDDFALLNSAPYGTTPPVTVYSRCGGISEPTTTTTTTTSSTTTTTLPGATTTTTMPPTTTTTVPPHDPTPEADPDVVTPLVPVPQANNFVVPLPSDPVAQANDSKFCSGNDVSGWVAMSSATRRKLLRTARGNRVVQLHDKLVLTLTSMGLRFNLLTDLAVGDVVREGRRYYLKLSTGAKIRISRSLASSISKYLRTAGMNRSFGEPMFREFYGGKMSHEPLCPSQMAELVKSYAAKGKLLGKVSFY